jgi:hypothetical protein
MTREGSKPMKRQFRAIALAILMLALAAQLLAGCGGAIGTSTTAGAATTISPITTETLVATATTTPVGPSATRSLTFMGSVSSALWQSLRAIVIDVGGDGQAVLDGVGALSVGDPVLVPSQESDSLSGIGFSAGAVTSQPIGVGQIPEDGEALIFAFTVPGQPEATTIVGFQRGTGRVVLVEGPLPIDDSTRNITTVPAP